MRWATRFPRARVLVLALLALAALGARCGGGSGSGGSPPTVDQSFSDPRCVALADLGGFPPGYAFVPQASGGVARRALAGTSSQSNLVPLDIETVPFRLPAGVDPYSLPADSDGDGIQELFKSIDDVLARNATLALVTVSGDINAVLFVDPSVVGPRAIEVRVPAAFDPADFAPFPGLPAPGVSRTQTGITAAACVDAGPGAMDSRGELLVDAIPSFAWCNGPGSFPASFASGVAIVGDRLFVATSNLGADQGRANTQFLPGSVVSYELDDGDDPAVVSPSLATPDGRPYIVTSGFNPTHITPHRTADGRNLLLVGQTGAIGIRPDDPNTDELEAGALPITEGSIDVIDADALVLLATVPLRAANPSFGPIAIDPTRRLALFGDIAARHVHGLDLMALEALPAADAPGLPLDLPGAVVFDGLNPLEVPARVDGAPAVRCPGQIEGVAFNAAGDRVYALETCDGTVAAFDVDLGGDPSTVELRGRVTFSVLSNATAPLREDTLADPRGPGSLAVRPGIPGVDYAGPDVFFTIGEPEGVLCGVRIDAR